MNDCDLCVESGEVIARNADWRVILVDDQHYPGFCRVIWNRHVKEMTDLSSAQRRELMEVVWTVEIAMREVLNPEKINLASLGNVVPHLHWHVIPRYSDDMHFPNPIWGKVERSINPALQDRKELLSQLKQLIGERLNPKAGGG